MSLEIYKKIGRIEYDQLKCVNFERICGGSTLNKTSDEVVLSIQEDTTDLEEKLIECLVYEREQSEQIKLDAENFLRKQSCDLVVVIEKLGRGEVDDASELLNLISSRMGNYEA